MAKFERLRYIPMLVRAYQEARTRADSPGRHGMHSAVGDDLHMRAVDTSRTNIPAQYQESGVNNPLNHSLIKRRSKRRENRQPAAPVRKSTAGAGKTVKNGAALQKQTARVPNAGLNPVVKNLLRELRDTKQQLSQLTAIQSQLAQVQMKLDEQLQVLRKSVDQDREGTRRETDETASKT